MEKIIIRTKRLQFIGWLATSLLFILAYSLMPEAFHSDVKGTAALTVFLAFVFIGIFLYCLIGLLKRGEGEIILTEEGVEFKHEGWSHWDYVDTFWVVREYDSESDDHYLIVRLTDSSEIKCKINDLEKTGGEILALMKEYQGNSFSNKKRKHSPGE